MGDPGAGSVGDGAGGSEAAGGAGSAGTGGAGAGSGGAGGMDGGDGAAGDGEAGAGGGGAGGMDAGQGAADGSSLVGWAADPACGANGTTGGGEGAPSVTVTSIEELEAELQSSGPRVIAVSGTIATGGNRQVSGIRDKTLLGMDDAEITGGLVISGADNLIIKDIHFSRGSNDTVELTGSTCVWFDHCAFSDGQDGNLDIVRETNHVTVSWSRFFYTEGHDHMLTCLIGNGDDRPEDRGKLKVTLHHNWWGAGVKERMPRVRYGQVHVFNNYYRYESVSGDGGQSYCIAAGLEADLLVENNYFDGSNSPIRYQTNGEGTAKVTERGNEYVGTSGTTISTGDAFTPPYEYILDSGAAIKDIVMAGAGPR